VQPSLALDAAPARPIIGEPLNSSLCRTDTTLLVDEPPVASHHESVWVGWCIIAHYRLCDRLNPVCFVIARLEGDDRYVPQFAGGVRFNDLESGTRNQFHGTGLQQRSHCQHKSLKYSLVEYR
jgi:hypothetical protein